MTIFVEGAEDLKYEGPFSDVKSFGEILFKFTDVTGWVEDIAFSPSG